MRITLQANEWGCIVTAVRAPRLSRAIGEALVSNPRWDEKITIDLLPEEVEDFHLAYEREFGESYHDPADRSGSESRGSEGDCDRNDSTGFDTGATEK